MAEPLLGRFKRIVSAGIEGVTDTVERVSGPLVMRETIREVERAADRVSAARDKARLHASQAVARQRALRDQLATLDQQARFAIGHGREDLAQVAVSQQLDKEEQLRSLDEQIGQARRDEAAFEAQLSELNARKAQMKRDYALFERTQRSGADAGPGLGGQAGRKVARAEATFGRAMSAVSGAGYGLCDTAAAAAASEVETLQRQAELDERLAALRQSASGSGDAGTKQSAGKRSQKR
jgi:hypothetical protein